MNWQAPLLLPENFLWAWRKVKRSYRMADSLYDQAEVAAFELNLEAELASIAADFAAGQWVNQPLRLVPQPKKPDKDNRPRLRQYFEVAVRDQVAWTALVNVLGPELDRQMPAWSYGNRLYRAAWYEDEPVEGQYSRLNIGPYRHAAGHLYRHFKHSWPLYRRHISLTARKMVIENIDPLELDHGERLALEQGDVLAYLDHGYWTNLSKDGETIYAASFDLRKFYPSVRIAAILRSLEMHVDGYRDDPLLPGLVAQLLCFTVDDQGLSPDTRKRLDPEVGPGRFDGIPTGLFVGGFLANAAMLPLDLEVDRLLTPRRDIAHFRFVDDHEVLAYDFETLCEWIANYIGLLEKHGIGPEVEPDKYVPSELKWILHDKLEDKPPAPLSELSATAMEAAAVNGRKPTQLMTRTLAQVSMLAAIDFDLLTEAGRGQRLEQLEWLLLANIPEHEIRGDTRMAFAAARIAALTPSLFQPSEALLKAYRELETRRLSKRKGDSELEATTTLETRIAELSASEAKTWSMLLRRHFGLLFEAFATHPDKVRLFIRLLDYCRATGHDGLPKIAEWMEAQADATHRPLKAYLAAMALHVLARHILSASIDLARADLLHRDRRAAHGFLSNLASDTIDILLTDTAETEPMQSFEASAERVFKTALLLGALEVDASDPPLAAAMRRRAGLRPQAGVKGLAQLASRPGIGVGVWAHWFFATTNAYRDRPPAYWQELAEAHDPRDPLDWNSLRRYPRALPKAAWPRLREAPTLLAADDAGWLLDAARAQGDAFKLLEQAASDNPAVAEVSARLDKLSASISLTEWVAKTRKLPRNDPRRSEWTALEIVRQVLAPLIEHDALDLDAADPDYLDIVHPENVRIPIGWDTLDDISLVNNHLTWEGWRALAAKPVVKVERSGLEDYRYRETLAGGNRGWPRRLRAIGQLLWGILRGSFELPAAWNIRGQERGLIEIVVWDVERLPISSFTLAILQSCLLPRNRESALLRQFPVWFGNLANHAADDTAFDQPIDGPEALNARVVEAQSQLQQHQLTVLQHAPRQLIPVRLRQIGEFGDGLLEPEAIL